MQRLVLANCVPEPNSGCWLWLGRVNESSNNGYGYYGPSLAHVISYVAFRGCIPDDFELDHLCRVRSCVNPWHLELVTKVVNILRGKKTKLSDVQVSEIISLFTGGRAAMLIAKQYKITASHVWRLAKGDRRCHHKT